MSAERAPRKRLLTIGHSYVVRRNRELAHALARAGGDDWEVNAVAPLHFPGDFGALQLNVANESGLRVHGVDVKLAHRIHLMRYHKALKKLLQQHWDVVHCWEEPFIVAGAQVARWTQPSARLVYATFQNISKRYPPPFGALERYSLRHAAGWIAFGETVQEALAERRGYENLEHCVIPLGVDLERFAPNRTQRANVRAELGWDDNTPVFGFLGRFVEQKGVRRLMRRLDSLDTPWRALFVGGGALESELRAWGAARAEGVRIVTGIAHDNVAAYLNAMDVLCAPSTTTKQWQEQLGRMAIEALACGVPVVASDSGELPHVVGDAGVVVPEADDAAWQRTLSRLANDEAQRGKLARTGRARAETKFAWRVIAGQYLSFFDHLLAQA